MEFLSSNYVIFHIKDSSMQSNSDKTLNHVAVEKGFATRAENSPVTYSRVQALSLDQYLEKPAIARANVAVSKESPNGKTYHAKALSDYVSLLIPKS